MTWLANPSGTRDRVAGCAVGCGAPNCFGLHNQILLPTVSQFCVSKYTRLYLKIHKIVSQNTPDCVSKYTTLYLKIHQIVSQNTPDCISAHTHFKPFKQSAKNVPVNEGKTHAS